MKETNKKQIVKGLRTLAFTLPLIVLGPSVTYSSFNNKEHQFYEIVLTVGISIMILAIILMFNGIKTIIKGIFN